MSPLVEPSPCHDRGQAEGLPGPGVSVVVTAYNYADVLTSAVESVLKQTHPRFEVLVIDDGSTDSTRQVVAPYLDRVRYVYQENAGLSAARNTGLRLARYPYVAFLDADDIWLPDMLLRLSTVLTGLPDDFVLAACRYSGMDENGRLFTKKVDHDKSPPGEIRFEDLLLRNRFAADSVVASRQALLDCGGFDEALTAAEDRDMWLRLAADGGRLYRVHETLLKVRFHRGSMSTSAERMRDNDTIVLSRALQSRKGQSLSAAFRAQVFSFCAYQVAWMFHEEGRASRAIASLGRSVVLWPWFLFPHDLNEPFLFRARSLRHFVCKRRWSVLGTESRDVREGGGAP